MSPLRSTGRHGVLLTCDMATPAPIAHKPVPSSDTSREMASPVRSRWNNAVAIPPAMVIAPIESPKAGPGWEGMRSSSVYQVPMAAPDRTQNEVMS